jgi:spore coat protein U-like protein
MTLGPETITYGLYRDSARSLVWGSLAGSTVSGSGNGTATAHPVYGRVPPQATPPPGTYSDTVVATVTY